LHFQFGNIRLFFFVFCVNNYLSNYLLLKYTLWIVNSVKGRKCLRSLYRQETTKWWRWLRTFEDLLFLPAIVYIMSPCFLHHKHICRLISYIKLSFMLFYYTLNLRIAITLFLSLVFVFFSLFNDVAICSFWSFFG